MSAGRQGPAAEAGARPIVVGLTGGIGSGKSSVLQTLVALGGQGIDADRVAHEVMAASGPAYAPIVAEFGHEVLAADGQINRQALARRVFGRPEALRRLEAITHPAVYEAIRARVAAARAPLVAIEAIKLLEAGLSRALCDHVWVTVARPEQQVARLVAGRKMAPAEIERRIAAQMPAAEMARQADLVIDTSGTLSEARLQVFRGWADLGLSFPPAEMRAAQPADAEGIAAVLNGAVRAGGQTLIDRTFTVDEEHAFLKSLPARALVTVATVAGYVAGFQIVDLYAPYTGAMDHSGSLGTFVAAGLHGRGIGRALTAVTLARAREAGFSKLVIHLREDNREAHAFYGAIGFQPCGRLGRQALVDGRYVDVLLYEIFI